MNCLPLQITGAKYPTLGDNYGSRKSTKLSRIPTCSRFSSGSFQNLRLSTSNFKSKPSKPFVIKSQVSDLAPAASAAYGILLFSGGIFAFSKSRSKGSLFGGLTGAALMTTAYVLMQEQETKAVGDAIGFGSSFLFSCVFGIRLAATQKLIPSGPLLGLSICSLAVFISSYFQDTVP
ncbi:protein FATTY ACID EXPORT 4, chloroplastic [Euphorbia lathyris]|uniref:protein FATTY ACID EXPORT 4, chloroplastic n=1 Tax=Euphorbia lathyris TaxID=212925 RepID=UPI00331430EA